MTGRFCFATQGQRTTTRKVRLLVC